MRLSAGIMIPNPTFGIPDEAGNGASLWSMNGTTATTVAPISGPLGRRAIRVTRTATGSRLYTSGYSTRSYPVGWASTSFIYAAMWWRSADGGAGDSVTLSLIYYDASGAEINDESLITESGASATSTWEVSRASVGITTFSSSEPVYLGLRLTFAGAATWDLAFAGVGQALDGASPGYYDMTADPIHTPGGGSYGYPMSDSPKSITARGQSMAMDGDRLLNPYRVTTSFENVSAAERLALSQYWAANNNGLYVPSSSSQAGVRGGSYPILLDHELSDSTIPPVMYADWEGEFGFAPWAMEWQSSTPYFDGQASFRERVYR